MAVLEWSSLTDVKAYPQQPFAAPIATADVVAVSLGPAELSDSEGVLNRRYWQVTQNVNTGNVEITGAVGGAWGSAAILFREDATISRVSLTFDQQGRPIIFYLVGVDTLKLRWYDPVLQEETSVILATGTDPTACFDFPQDASQVFTDAILSYQRADKIYTRVQRDRFEVEREAPAVRRGFNLTSAGLRTDNRVQVVYLPVRDPGRFDP